MTDPGSLAAEVDNVLTLSIDDKISCLEVPDIVTVDTEGSSRMLGFSVAFDGPFEGFYFPFTHVRDNLTVAQQLKVYSILEQKEALAFHNAVHDLRILKRAGFDYRGKFYDTMLMCHWLNEEEASYALDWLSKANGFRGKSMPVAMSTVIDSDGWDHVPAKWMDLYSSNDAYIQHLLLRRKLPRFIEEGFDGELWEVEQKFIRDVMGPMMDKGILIDKNFVAREYLRGLSVMEEAQKELGFKPTSPKALEKFLIQELELPVVKHTKACKKCNPDNRRLPSQPVSTHTARPSFDKDAMEEYELLLEKRDDLRAKTILRYRGWMKTTSSNYLPYLRLADENGVLHPGYKLHGTKTGRLSCAEPNLQQIPKSGEKDWNGNLKAAFVAREGYELWTIDYAQLQFRMACAYADCSELLAIFNDPTRDIFDEMSKQMGWLRQDVKTLVYLMLFGGGAKRASVAFGVSIAQGKEIIEEFYANYPELRKIAKMAEMAAKKQGYVAYWTGRRRHFPRGSAYYRAFNAVIQGGEAEIIKRAMVVIVEFLAGTEECYPVLQIHDEIVFEIKIGLAQKYLPRLQELMEKAGSAFNEHPQIAPVAFKTSVKKWGEK